MKERQRWQDGLLLMVGVWLGASPWLTGALTNVDPPHEPSFWAFMLLGPFVAFFGVLGLATLTKVGHWAELALSAGLLASPFLFNFSQNQLFAWNAFACGALVLLLAGSALATPQTKQVLPTA